MPPLIPVPPMSMPISGAFFFDFSSFLANVVPFVAGGGARGGCGPGPAGEDRGSSGGAGIRGRVSTSAPVVRDQQGVLELRGAFPVAGDYVQSSAHMSPVHGAHVSIGSIVKTMPVSMTVL